MRRQRLRIEPAAQAARSLEQWFGIIINSSESDYWAAQVSLAPAQTHFYVLDIMASKPGKRGRFGKVASISSSRNEMV